MTPSKKASAAKKTATVRSRSAGRASAARPAARKAAVAKVGKAAVPKKAAAKKVVSKRGGGVAKQVRRSDVKATTRKANPVHKATTTAATGATPSRNGRQSAPVGSSSGSAAKKAVGAKAAATKASTPKKSTTAQGKPATVGAKATRAVTAGSGARTTSTKAPSRTAAPASAKSAAAGGSGARSAGTRGATAAPSAPVTGSLAQEAHGGPTTNGSAAAATSEARPSPARPYESDAKFLDEQRQALLDERAVYVGQAADLKAEADSLAADREPGDVQFDEESGEGGTFTVDRERDLALSAQALAAVEEIDAALERIDLATYGACERCQQPIPKSRLRALPYARLCVACKSGGLSRR